MLSQVKVDNIIFLGDSAGGGLSLRLSQKLYKDKKQGPSQIVLIAPWLDVTMSDSEIKKIDPLDKLLNVDGLVWAGKIDVSCMACDDWNERGGNCYRPNFKFNCMWKVRYFYL